MAKPDRHFMNVFGAVLGILVLISLALIGISRFVDSGPKGARDTEDPLLQAEAHERIRPFGQVAVAGEDNTGLAIPPPPGAVPTAAAAGSAGAGSSLPTEGKAVYELACVTCHGAGLAGAPKLGDRGAWGPRVAQGMETLEQHAIQGYQGSVGFMPAKGGRPDLPDEAVRNAVDYMVSQSR